MYEHKSLSVDEKCPRTARTYQELKYISDWAIEHADKNFALGVLASLNYIMGRDDKTPEGRMGDSANILKAAEPPEWVGIYIKNVGLPKLCEE